MREMSHRLVIFQFLETLPLCTSSPFVLVSVFVSIRWVIGLSRLVGVASGGFSRG